ncbi:MAG: hypothetical protein KatS3mg105_4957 [Gemmatales bacterium]|nr:MAG: hypothetical protein KatS3mg105_4957 [Gemmatales bacterium]
MAKSGYSFPKCTYFWRVTFLTPELSLYGELTLPMTVHFVASVLASFTLRFATNNLGHDDANDAEIGQTVSHLTGKTLAVNLHMHAETHFCIRVSISKTHFTADFVGLRLIFCLLAHGYVHTGCPL